jgi:hypothetical protein
MANIELADQEWIAQHVTSGDARAIATYLAEIKAELADIAESARVIAGRSE